MPPRSTRSLLLLVLGLMVVPARAEVPVGTAFTYQGRLAGAGNPASGPFDFEFRLFDAPASGAQVGATIVHDDVAVSSGRFTVSLDFGGAAFAGSKRWLEVRVRPGAGGTFVALSPLQEVTPSPQAAFSAM